MAYDALGRLTGTTFADGTTTAVVFDGAGQEIAFVDERGNSTTSEYDDAGRQTQRADALGNTMAITWDAAGNQATSVDARGNTTSFTYDALNRRTTTALADGTTTTTAYDALGRTLSQTDQAGRTTQFGYDALGRLTSVTDALGQVTSYAYDEVGNLTSQTDANGNTTLFAYDALGRQIMRTLPDGSVESRTYNPDGTVAARTDFLGRTTTFSYDVNNRLSRRDQPDGTSVTWTYTATGRVASYSDPRGQTTFLYDARDRMTSMVYPDGRRLDYAYDAGGNRTAITATVGTAVLTTTYSYDAIDRLQTVTDSSGGVYTHSYDGVGNRTGLDYPNGVTTSTMFDALNRLSLMSTSSSVGSTLQSYAFTLDPTGRRTSIAEADGTTRDYAYDPLYRLTQDRVTDGAATLVYQRDYAYDPVGNRLGVTVDTGSGPVLTSYSYDSRDRLLTEGAVTYSYDANGSLVSKSGTADYGWDTEHRLSDVTRVDGTEIRTVYDPDGNWVSTETTPPGGPTATIEYLVDVSGAASHVIVESDEGGNVLAHYERGDELLSLFRPASLERRYYHADGVGSVRLLSDETEAVTDAYTYTAFGVLLEHAGTDIQPYRFTGEPFDPNIGFAYHRARWLDLAVGRFVSQDPFAGNILDPPSLHRYLYASVDPANMTDPLGLFTLGGLLISAAIVGALSGMITGAILGGFRGAIKGAITGAILTPLVTLGIVALSFGIAAFLGVSVAGVFAVVGALSMVLSGYLGVRGLLNAETDREKWAAGVGLAIMIASLGVAKVKAPRTATAIGAKQDVKPLKDVPGFDVLDVPDHLWTRGLNRGWLQGGIDRNNVIMIRTNPAKWRAAQEARGARSEFLELELPQLEAQNFRAIGPFMVRWGPP